MAFTSLVRDLIAEGVESGEFRADVDAVLASQAMLGMLNASYRWYQPKGKYSAAEVVQECLRMIMSGLLAQN